MLRVQLELAAARDGADDSAAAHAALEARLRDADAALKVRVVQRHENYGPQTSLEECTYHR